MEQSIPKQPWFAGRRVLIAALILGAITAGLIVAFLATRDDDSTSPVVADTVEVVVAKQDIAVGTEITRSMLEVRELPREAIIAGAATEIGDVAGETTRYPLVSGEQINLQRLVDAPSGKALSFTIPDGMRGFTVPVDVTRSPAGVIVAGDFVDVIVAFGLIQEAEDGTLQAVEVDGGDQLKSAVTILQNIQVLSVERDYVDEGVEYTESTRGDQPDEDNINYVTLAVTPEQAQQLWLITQDGELTLSLRGFGDDGVDPLDPTDEPFDLGGTDEPEQLTQ